MLSGGRSEMRIYKFHATLDQLGSMPVGFLHVSRCCHLLAGIGQKRDSLPASAFPWQHSPEFGLDPRSAHRGRGPKAGHKAGHSDAPTLGDSARGRKRQ